MKKKLYTLIIVILILFAVIFTYIQLKEGGKESLKINYDLEIKSNTSSQYTIYIPYSIIIAEYGGGNGNVDIEKVDTDKAKLLSVTGKGNTTISKHYEENGNCIWNPINFSYERIKLTGQNNRSHYRDGKFWVYLENNEEYHNISINLKYEYIQDDQFVYAPHEIILNGSISHGWNLIEESGKIQRHGDKFGTLSGARNLSIFVDSVIAMIIIILVLLIRKEDGKGNQISKETEVKR